MYHLTLEAGLHFRFTSLFWQDHFCMQLHSDQSNSAHYARNGVFEG